MVILVIVTAIAVIGLAYWFWGRNFIPSMNSTPAPSASPTTFVVPTGSPTASPKATKSPTPTPTPKPVSKSITVGSTNALDGFESSNGGGNIALEIRVGRNINLITRGLVSFTVPSELQGKQVDKAVMRLYQAKVVGSPYTVGGNIMVDHIYYGGTLDNSAYALTSLSQNFAILTGNPVIEYKDVDVKDQLIDDLGNGRTYSQYRIHFSTETIGGDASGDFAYYESQDNSMGTGNQPQLVITYH